MKNEKIGKYLEKNWKKTIFTIEAPPTITKILN